MWDINNFKQKILEWLSPNKGRMNGIQYALCSVVCLLVTGLFIKLLFQSGNIEDSSWIGIFFGLYCFVVVGAKRLRAVNLSAWYLLVYLFTPINLLFFFYLAFTTRGEQTHEAEDKKNVEPIVEPDEIGNEKTTEVKETRQAAAPKSTIIKQENEEKLLVSKEVPAKPFVEVSISTVKAALISKAETKENANSKLHPFKLKEVFANTYFANKSVNQLFKTTQAKELPDISPSLESQKQIS